MYHIEQEALYIIYFAVGSIYHISCVISDLYIIDHIGSIYHISYRLCILYII